MTETVTLPGLESTPEPPEVVPAPAMGHWIERGPQKRLMVFSGRSHPDLADAISEKVIERRDHLDSIRSAEKEEVRSVLARIRAYFGL